MYEETRKRINQKQGHYPETVEERHSNKKHEEATPEIVAAAESFMEEAYKKMEILSKGQTWKDAPVDKVW